MLSEHRNPAAAKRFFRSAKTVTGVIPDRAVGFWGGTMRGRQDGGHEDSDGRAVRSCRRC